MGSDVRKLVLWAGIAIIGLQGRPLAAETETVQAIRDATIIDIPLVLGEVDQADAASALWSKGDKPVNSLLARFSIRPVEVATTEAAGGEQPQSLLWRAIPGGSARVLNLEDLYDAKGARYFCGSQPGARGLSCFIDEDGNGSFDHVAEAATERGSQPYHITVIKAQKPLVAPQAYRILGQEQRPAISIDLRNCAKDYDRPRYTALSTSDRGVPMMQTGFVWHDKDSSFASCRRGTRIDSYLESVTPPAGGYLAQIGPLAFSVGPKNDARLTLLGPVDAAAFYRLEGNSLVPISIGHTPNQAKLVALKKFPYPTLLTEAGATVHAGSVAVGQTLASIPFRHAYRGKLTQDVMIATLFGKRSLAAGTILYGFPAKAQLTRTINGMPDIQTVGDDEYRKINLQLTWCAPIHSVDPVKQKPDAVGKNGWSAACIPHSILGNYTILTERQPAFNITGVSYDANTSSNEGSPPVERQDESDFGQPLRIEYIFAGRVGEFISLNEQIYFGGELTSSSVQKLYAPAGKVAAKLAGVSAELTADEKGALLVSVAGAPQIGSSPLLKWDQQAYLLQQLQKLGMRMAPPSEEAGDAGSSIPASVDD